MVDVDVEQMTAALLLVSSSSPVSSSGPGGDVGLTATLRAQESAAAALLRRSQEATRSMLDQAEAVRRREQSLTAGPTAGFAADGELAAGGKGKSAYALRRAAKSKEFFQRRTLGKKQGKGKG